MMILKEISINEEQFQRKCFYNHLFNNEESIFDRVMEIFLNEILDLNFFKILSLHKIKLKVKNQSYWTTPPDFLAHYLILNVFEMICIEYKPDNLDNLSQKEKEDAETQ